jgi:hypothetical protein
MRAQLFIEGSPCAPASAWASRPLASGARSTLIGRRGCSNVSLGCPSCGGQRTDGGGSSRLLARLVTSLSPALPGKQVGALFLGSSSQTARLAPLATEGGMVVDLCLGKVAAPGPQVRVKSSGTGLTETAEFPTPVRHSRRAVTASSVQRLARWSHSGLPATVGAHQPPNPSVEGTSCGKPQAAPHLER